MAEGDRPAMDVGSGWIEAEFTDAGDRLAGEGLVQLHAVDLLRAEPRARQQLRDRWDRADPHDRRVNASNRGCNDPRKWLQAECPRAARLHDEQRRGTVVDAGCVSCGDTSTFGKCWPQLCKARRIRLWSWVLVLVNK